MFNHIAVMGRLARDPELRRTNSGTAVTSFSLACERDVADKQSGEKAVDFIDCVAWGGTAEIADRYLSKGDMATVSGRLQIRQYTNKAGQKRRTAEIKVDSVYFFGSKESGAQNRQKPDTGYAAQPAEDFVMLEDADTKLPF